MKIIIFFTLLLALTITGCQKEPEQPVSTEATDPVVKAQFEKSDAIINTYLDKLDSVETPHAERVQIICKNYPAEYKANYMPSLMKLSPGEYTEGKLIKDLDIALDYYKKKDNIQC
ncbi:hypothetical protein [Acinetobacter sp. F16]|uniref:hypothetical protein n=1 Tax=Acinetobacter sp. F16 TaxID=3462438 RepID=UPI004046C0FF